VALDPVRRAFTGAQIKLPRPADSGRDRESFFAETHSAKIGTFSKQVNDELQALEPVQRELLPADEVFFADLESKGQFTGERLAQRRPDAYRAIQVMLAKGIGVIAIGKLMGVSPNTVLAVRDREQPGIEAAKAFLARTALGGATLAAEGIAANLDRIFAGSGLLGVKDLKELATIQQQMLQTHQLVTGQPTSRLEVLETQRAEQDDFNRYIDGLPELKIEAVLTDLAAEKNAGSESAPHSGVASAPANADARPDEEPRPTSASAASLDTE
jgi:hypothetical protein